MKPFGGVLVGLALASVSACGGDPSARGARTTIAGDASPAASNDTETAKERRRLGTPPSGTLLAVAVSPDGRAAVSLDELGGVRLWPALDGSQEPIALRESLTALDIEASGQGWLVGGVDPAGSAHLSFIGPNGLESKRFSTPPQPSALDIEVLRDGGLAVLGADHVLRVYHDGTGEEEPRAIVRRGFRPTRVIERAGGELMLVAANRGDSTIDLDIDLRATGERVTVSVPVSSAMQLEGLAVSPSGRRAAILVKSGSQVRVHLVDVASGARTEIAPDGGMPTASGLAFLSETRLVVSAAGSLPIIDVPDDLSTARIVDALPSAALHLAPLSIDINDKTTVMGAGDHLYVLDMGSRRGSYLGYRGMNGAAQALSPDGTRMAWTDNFGHVVVRELATGETFTLASDRGPTAQISFVDRNRLIAIHHPQRLAMIDATTGQLLAEAAVQTHGIELRGDLLLETGAGQLFRVQARGLERLGSLTGLVRWTKLIRKDGAWVVAALGTDGRLRILDAATLQRGVDRVQWEALPGVPDYEVDATLDDQGRRYSAKPGNVVRTNTDGTTVHFTFGPGTSPLLGGISEDGTRVVVANLNQHYSVFDGDTGKELWGTPRGAGSLQWSQDFTRVLSVAQGSRGSLILDGRTGRPLAAICGYGFGASPAPPANRPSVAREGPPVCSGLPASIE